MKEKGHLRIGQVAKQTGLNPKTIRYYEEIDIIPPPTRSEVISGNGYRLYSPKDVARLQMVKRVRQLGLPLKEVRSLVKTAEKGCCPTVDPKLAQVLRTQISEIDQKIKELAELKVVLTNLSRSTASSSQRQSQRKSEACRSPGCFCS